MNKSAEMPALNDGQLDAALDDARADGVTGETGGVVNVELLHEMLAMLLDGLDADAEFRRGLLVGLALGDDLVVLGRGALQAVRGGGRSGRAGRGVRY